MAKILYSALDNYGGYPFAPLFEKVVPVYDPEDMVTTDGVLCLWGGEDISPSLYSERPNTYCGATATLSARDRLEVALAKDAMARGIPIIGICRGAQLMCALAGGKVIQHVTGHAIGHDHILHTQGSVPVVATSLHHQMMYPWAIRHDLIAWTTHLSTTYLGEDDKELSFPREAYIKGRVIEPEIVMFPQIKTLGIQGHPEFIANDKHDFVAYSLSLIRRYLLNDSKALL